jgi:hypothetical protein
VNATAAPSVFSMEDFFKAMRRDLGLDNRNLKRGDLLALIFRLKDLQQFLRASQANPNVSLQDLPKE